MRLGIAVRLANLREEDRFSDTPISPTSNDLPLVRVRELGRIDTERYQALAPKLKQ